MKATLNTTPSHSVTSSGDTATSTYTTADPEPQVQPGKAKAVLNLDGRSDRDLGAFGRTVSHCIDQASLLPPTDPTVLAVKEATAQFEATIIQQQAAQTEYSRATTVKEDARQQLERALQNLQLAVQSASKGDATFIVANGLPIKRRRQPVGDLPAPAAPNVQPGQEMTTMDLRWPPVKNARGYIIEYTTSAAPHQWESQKISTRAHIQLTGLIPGLTYRFRISSIGGRKGQSLWSPIVTRVCS